MENSLGGRNFEEKHLSQIISIAQKKLSSVKLRNAERKDTIVSLKKELREETSHSISNLWDPENFEALVELSQFANPISDKLVEYETDVNTISSLERMIVSPYFARIDFKFDDENTAEKVYIGRSSLAGDKSHELYIYDWRSPLASVFYRFGTGKAFYEAPAGKITGEVSLKRQYEIKKGKLEYFFDADLQIFDEFLRKLLSQNASSKMKTIIETIQKDQDIIIRDMETDLLMVQGAAGSGKTSVALHRVAYLMYKGLSTKLSNSDIVVISPNTLFEKYISGVLPELGERNVNSIVFEEILRNVLRMERVQTKNHFLECLLSSSDKKHTNILRSGMDFKGSGQFVEILNRFIDDLPNRWIEFRDVYYDGECIASRQSLKAKLLKRDKNSPMGLRLKYLENYILDLARMLSIDESTALIKTIRQFTELDYFELYRKLFSNKTYFYSLAKGLELPDCIEDIIDLTCENLKKDYLHYDDASALAFLHLRTKGYADYQSIKQVVVDEAQDYYPIHFEILNCLFSDSRYTILGDINQTIGKQENLSLYDQIGKILNKKKSILVTLDKSFRCTEEILKYSTRFLNKGFKHHSFSRRGDAPAVFTAQSKSALDNMIINEVINCGEKGYRSIALICKTEQDAISLYGRLKDLIDVQLIKSNAETDLHGAFILPIYMSKGLEFDSVLICDADKDHFHSEDDKNLLYIACTRALHRLNLFYTGEISPLLQTDGANCLRSGGGSRGTPRWPNKVSPMLQDPLTR